MVMINITVTDLFLDIINFNYALSISVTSIFSSKKNNDSLLILSLYKNLQQHKFSVYVIMHSSFHECMLFIECSQNKNGSVISVRKHRLFIQIYLIIYIKTLLLDWDFPF